MEEVEGYAQLVKRGMPHFIEVKGVTYCGESTANFLTIKKHSIPPRSFDFL